MESTQIKPAEEAREQAAPAAPKFKPPKKKRKWLKRLIVILVIVAVLVLLLSQCMQAGTQLVAGIYLPSTVEKRDMTVSVSGTGAIEPIHAYRATTLVSGSCVPYKISTPAPWRLPRPLTCRHSRPTSAASPALSLIHILSSTTTPMMRELFCASQTPAISGI